MEADARLDTGMKVGEAIEHARKWWGEHRGAISKDFNRREEAPVVRGANGGAPAIIILGEVTEDVPDGILSGRPWEELTDQERVVITKQWHHHHVRLPILAAKEGVIPVQ